PQTLYFSYSLVGTVERQPLVLVDKPPARRPVGVFAESAVQALFAPSRLNSDIGVIVRIARLAHNVRSGTSRQTARGLSYFRSCFLALRRDSNGCVQSELKDRFPGNDPLPLVSSWAPAPPGAPTNARLRWPQVEHAIATVNSEIFLETERARPSELALAPTRAN